MKAKLHRNIDVKNYCYIIKDQEGVHYTLGNKLKRTKLHKHYYFPFELGLNNGLYGQGEVYIRGKVLEEEFHTFEIVLKIKRFVKNE